MSSGPERGRDRNGSRASSGESGPRSSKPRVSLLPEQSTASALAEILRALTGALRANEHGVLHDPDPEYLHQYRVAVRRIRTCLALARGTLEPEALARYREEFSRLGAVTGPARDLDVYRLSLGEYRGMLPKALRSELDPLETVLRDRRRQEQSVLRAALETEAYREFVRVWEVWLCSPGDGGSPDAADRIGNTAAGRIERRYDAVRRRGRKLAADSPPQVLHRLRIACKKLRYVLEFFASLLPADAASATVRQLKRLQDALGAYNDFAVQQTSLTRFAAEVVEEGRAGARRTEALDVLRERLRARQQDVRGEVVERFARFASRETRRRVRDLAAHARAGTG